MCELYSSMSQVFDISTSVHVSVRIHTSTSVHASGRDVDVKRVAEKAKPQDTVICFV
jgi:hypothetical protein